LKKGAFRGRILYGKEGLEDLGNPWSLRWEEGDVKPEVLEGGVNLQGRNFEESWWKAERKGVGYFAEDCLWRGPHQGGTSQKKQRLAFGLSKKGERRGGT